MRYPLVVLLDDGTLDGTESPYLLDAVGQLSGHAIQMLAASGFMVLYTREPRSAAPEAAGAHECERMREHVETAIAKLDDSGLIDRDRVGISGWSRAAYHTNCILMRASHRFAAATQIDGGGREFIPRGRPFSDEKLIRIRTPLLLETHGLRNLVNMSAMADRLEALDKQVEVLHFPTASHLMTRPGHRLRSLQTHIDWWRFWLLGLESEDPEKTEQYERCRHMRAKLEAGALRRSSLSGPGG